MLRDEPSRTCESRLRTSGRRRQRRPDAGWLAYALAAAEHAVAVPGEPAARAVGSHAMTGPVADRLAAATLAIVALVDRNGDPRAWPVAGPAGFARTLGPGLVCVEPATAPPRELIRELGAARVVSLLVVGPGPRSVLGLSGGAAIVDCRLVLAVDDAWTNPAPGGRPERARRRVGFRPRTTRRDLGVEEHRIAARRMVAFAVTGGPAAALDRETARRVCVVSVDLSSGRWRQVLAELAPARALTVAHGARLPLGESSDVDLHGVPRCASRSHG
jgi:hypothetical protein